MQPPATNSARQPPNSRMGGATRPDVADPREIPQASNATNAVRLFTGAYSAPIASALGRLAPRPMPVRRRQKNSSFGVLAVEPSKVERATRAKELE